MSLHPSVSWAQRKDQIFITIDLQDVKDADIKLEANKLAFAGTSNGKKYETNLEFTGEIDPKESRYAVKPRAIEFVLAKKESGPYWDSLLKSGKQKWLKADWNKWKDEDEVDEEDAGFDMSGMGGGFGGMDGLDMNALQAMGGGMPGMPGMNLGGNFDDEEGDSDGEEMPELEEDEELKKKKEAEQN